jgi:hypothetical protein
LLLVVAILFYIPWLGLLADPVWSTSSGEGRYSQGWVEMFALLFGTPLWLALGGLTLLAWRKGFAPPDWAAWSESSSRSP